MKEAQVDRRRFIALSVAAAGTCALPHHRGDGRPQWVRWESLEGFPDRPTMLVLSGPLAEHGGALILQAWVETPQGPLAFTPVELELSPGQSRLPLTLTYPFETRVNGAYRYHAEVNIGGLQALTASPATYTLRPLRLFA